MQARNGERKMVIEIKKCVCGGERERERERRERERESERR